MSDLRKSFLKGELVMSRNSEHVKRWRERTKARLVEAMGGECVCCGYKKSIWPMEMHHLDTSKKEFGLGSSRANIVSWKRISEEASKCVMLCSNCHKEVHQGITVVPPTAKSFDQSFANYKELEKSASDAMDQCPICGKSKPSHLFTCSHECGATKAGHVDWEKIDVLKLKEQGKSYAEIGEMLNVSGGAVYKYIKKVSSVTTKGRTFNRCKVPKPSLEYLEKEHETKTLEEIGKDFGVTGGSVGYWIQQLKSRKLSSSTTG